jgi:chorismate dehydratase
MQKLRISAVSYLNSLPFVYGIKNSGFLKNIELSLDVPSVCADKLISGKADIGLVPVAAIPLIKNAQIVSDFCIGADGKVQSVLLISRKPLQEIQKVYLDLESRTSVGLAKVLAKEYWKISPEWEPLSANIDFENIEAVVLIGDKTFSLPEGFTYIYDLAAEWKNFTGLPFVFACWVANREISPEQEEELNKALAYGVGHTEEAAGVKHDIAVARNELLNYLRYSVSYNFDDNKKAALKLFMEKLSFIAW